MVEGIRQLRRQDGIDVVMSNQESSRSNNQPINRRLSKRVNGDDRYSPQFQRQNVSTVQQKEKERSPHQYGIQLARNKG